MLIPCAVEHGLLMIYGKGQGWGMHHMPRAAFSWRFQYSSLLDLATSPEATSVG